MEQIANFFSYIGNFLSSIDISVWGLIVGILTLLVTFIATMITIKIDRNSQLDPWTLIKLDDRRWKLTRNSRKRATLYAYAVDNHNSVEVCYENLAGLPLQVFGKNSYITFWIEGPIGGNITFYYKEYGTKTKNIDVKDYHGELGRYPQVPKI